MNQDYETLERLGSGSFGVVYKVRNRKNGEVSVMKQIDISKFDRRMKEWALNQAKIMREIDSPYIVRYLSSFVQKNKVYIFMQYCNKGDLALFIRGQMGKPLKQQTFWRFSLQIMMGLRDLHAKKILHRDIKAMNVFLVDNNTIRIGDLGVAKSMKSDFTSTVVGTPYYLSPQMCQQKPYNQKTDVWAMGCLFYQLCTGRHPFEANNQAALALKIITGKYSPVPPHYSENVAWIIRLCLSVDYKRRPTVQYLLTHNTIKNIASKYCIELSKLNLNEKNEEKDKKRQQIKKAQEKQQIKVEIKKKQIIKVEEKKVLQRKSIQKSRENSANKMNQQKIKANKQIQKQAPVKVHLPPQKPAVVSVASKKLQPDIKISPRIEVSQNLISEKKVEVQKNDKKQQKITAKVIVLEPLKKQNLVAGQDKNKKQPNQINRIQQQVNDDELFRQFGITPEKTQTLLKIDFKKVGKIDWNIEQKQEQQKNITQATKYTTVGCDFLAIDPKQDEEEVAQQIDDNAPYISQNEDEQDNMNTNQSLLLQDLDKKIQEEDELKKRQRLDYYERRVGQNEKRKKQLILLKGQVQNQLLIKMDRSNYEKLLRVLKEGSEEQIQVVMAKATKGQSGMVKMYKIFHFLIQIERCDQNIVSCHKKIEQLKNE